MTFTMDCSTSVTKQQQQPEASRRRIRFPAAAPAILLVTATLVNNKNGLVQAWSSSSSSFSPTTNMANFHHHYSRSRSSNSIEGQGSSSSRLSLFGTIEDQDQISDEQQQQQQPPPRPTRRIDDILEEYEETGDAVGTISTLESSLKQEQQKSDTLAIRLAYAEQVIEEQKKRLEVKRSSLQKKSQALSETQKKLQLLEKEMEARGMPPPPTRRQQQQQQQLQYQSPFPPLTSKQRQYPLVTNWSINRNTYEITGTVSSHPSIPDGTTIVTSGLEAESFVLTQDFVFDSSQPATVVTTKSGSMYQLGVQKIKRANQQLGNSNNNSNFDRPNPFLQQVQQQLHPSNNLNPNLEFPLTGQSISNGRGTKYLLAGTPKRKPSGRSEIIMAYKCDEQLKVCDNVPYVVKLSTSKDKLSREFENYSRVQDHLLANNDNGKNSWGANLLSNMFENNNNNNNFVESNNNDAPFVTCYDFLPVCEGSIKYAQHSALVLEKGHQDMRDYEFMLQEEANLADDEYDNNSVVMGPYPAKVALYKAAKCLQVLHSKARLVWTDLKAENLVFMEEVHSNHGSAQQIVVKGIDLESAIPHRGNPLDYTPEACPPEFARQHLQGKAYEFLLDYSYDVWSFGMLAYELATGRAYFRGKTPSEIMDILGSPNFVPPIEDGNEESITDPELRELIRACLQLDPRRRISVRNILEHSYFREIAYANNANNNNNIGGGNFW